MLDLQVTGSFQPDSAEEDEGMHGTRAAAGSSPGQALSPGPDKMLSQDEEDCMLEEEDCTEKHLAAGHELEGLLDVDDINIDNDDDVQFIGETGPGVPALAVSAPPHGVCSQQLASSMYTATCPDTAVVSTHWHTCPQRRAALVC